MGRPRPATRLLLSLLACLLCVYVLSLDVEVEAGGGVQQPHTPPRNCSHTVAFVSLELLGPVFSGGCPFFL